MPAIAEAEKPAETCPKCDGAGFVRRARSVDDPLFGKAEPCDCVLEEAADVRSERLQRVGKLGALARFTFASFETGAGEAAPAFRDALDVARAYASDPAGWLVITGPSGSGKTCLAAAIANALIERGEPALFTFVPDLLDHLRASYDATSEDARYAQLFEQVRKAPFLVLDDIAASSPTSWALEKLFQLVNSRYVDGLSTVLTCTSRVENLEDRLATRLGDARLSRVIALPSYAQVGGMTRERLVRMQFDNFDLGRLGLQSDEAESLQLAFLSARAYAKEPRGWLILQGKNGCGKTHLAAAIANACLSAGGSVFFAVVPQLLDHLRRSFSPNREAERDGLFERICETPLLILDDLGAQSTSPWAREKLYQVVNYRTVGGLATVVTTDQTLDAMRDADPRIFARIADPVAGMAAIPILAPHYQLGHLSRPREQRRAPR